MKFELFPQRKSGGPKVVWVPGPPNRLMAPLHPVQTATGTIMKIDQSGDHRAASVTPIHGMRPDLLASARYEHPSSVSLVFADGLSGVWSFHKLELEMADMRPTTIAVSASKSFMEVWSKNNDLVEIDASSLRAAVDPAYKAEFEKALLCLRGPLEGIATNAVSLPRK